MELQTTLPEQLAGFRGGLLLVEAERGRARKEVLEAWAERLRAGGQEPLLLPCDFREGGVWGGVAPWVGGLLAGLEREAPGLAEKHAVELAMVLRSTRYRNAAPVTLTDQAVGGEAVRNYAMDRAYRVAHGLVDLIDAWYAHAPPAPRVVICDGYDRAGALSRRFFRELLRRRGEKLGITLVAVVSPGAAGAARAEFAAGLARAEVRLELPTDPSGISPRMAAFAQLVEEGVRNHQFPGEHRFPELLRYWEDGGEPDIALPWMAYVLGRYNHYGFYEDALLFLEPVYRGIDRVPEYRDFLSRWNVVSAIYNTLVAVGQVERAYRVVQEEAFGKLTDPLDRARSCYVAAMVHARFLPEKDFDTAERFLREGLGELEKVDPLDEDRIFLHVFLGNGLALVRSRQGKPAEAVELCVTGLEKMNSGLGNQKHSLHRSVLLYNIAQVYTATREHDKAIEYFTAAMAMDPFYSEYHNERGNAFQALGRYDEAIRDYREAIRLSAPYQEVWTNLGQCYRKMGRMGDAVEAYSRALDLDPTVEVARVARAQVLAVLGRPGEAISDYQAALDVAEKERPQILANLAALLYGEGHVEEALDHLDQAVALAPDVAPLYRNRAVALEALGRADKAARDLGTYLALTPGVPDRGAVEEKIAMLEGSLAGV
ncbi:MAG TPA: tetratricopeptide repeat protein [Longimicrobium sp.]|nr:tetratricopeptide repeat protein [Longimicrobium sp.]